MKKLKETLDQRAARILNELKEKYPEKKCYDLDGRKQHFLAEIEPTADHPEYDVAVEVIIASKPHKHNKMTQHYKILKGDIELHYGNKIVNLSKGDKYTIRPGIIHRARSNNECWVRIRSEPGWTKEDHVVVSC